MSPTDHYEESDLPSTPQRSRSMIASIFGGDHVERRPGMLALAAGTITFVGFILGTLFTIAILTGLIEIDPKAIKSVIRTVLGKN